MYDAKVADQSRVVEQKQRAHDKMEQWHKIKWNEIAFVQVTNYGEIDEVLV